MVNTCRYVCTIMTHAKLKNRNPCTQVSDSSGVGPTKRIFLEFEMAENDRMNWLIALSPILQHTNKVIV